MDIINENLNTKILAAKFKKASNAQPSKKTKTRQTASQLPRIASISEETQETDCDSTTDNNLQSPQLNGSKPLNNFTNKNGFHQISQSSSQTTIGIHSINSSLRGSTRSLPVIRDRYCLCQRWSKKERNLVILVGLVAIIIVIVLMILEFMPLSNRHQPKFMWNI